MEIKPCPFCGTKAQDLCIQFHGDNLYPFVFCGGCGAGASFDINHDIYKAIEKWNRRETTLSSK